MNRNTTNNPRRRNGRQNIQGVPRAPSSNVTRYSGPTRLPVGTNPPAQLFQLNRLITVSLAAGTSFGFIATNADPETLPIAEFASFAALYDEYRVLSIEAQYVPYLRHGNGNVVTLQGGQPWLTVVLRNSGATPTAYSQLIENSSVQQCSVNENFTRRAKMDSTDEAQIIATNTAPSALFGISGFAVLSTMSTTCTYGNVLVRYMIEFRTRA